MRCGAVTIDYCDVSAPCVYINISYRIEYRKLVPVSRDRVQVFVGGVSDGRLQRGDVVTGIEQYDTTNIAHRQADDIIRAARDTLSISVRRSAAVSS